MALTPGTRLGVYEITAPLGEGGMGQVWRARDTKLDRDVAIKVLPEAFAHDAERLARFTREAKTLAALNHTNIAHIHGLEESGGLTALVMELVEGDDLSQRIARGAIPIDEALPIAKQIAEALEAAHEQGIIHRDLKPANIKVRADGTVKVLDFGLAKALDAHASPGAAEAMDSPTITSPAMTQAGMILGTAAYMAPEQARGKTVDRRADIWAFGAVLFEMLSGTRAFRGDDVTDTIVSVISKEPNWSAVPAATPARLRQLLTRCLKKDAKTRLQAIGDARVQLDELLSGATDDGASATPTTQAASASSSGRRPLLAALAAAAALIAAMAMPTLRHLRETPPPLPLETRTDINTPATDDPAGFALSPDGRQIVFVASGDGASRLWVRSLGATTAQPLAGTEGAHTPFWSPDARSLGFFASGALKRLDLAGGTAHTLSPATSPGGGTWNADGAILFAPAGSGPLMRVSATGGEVTAVTSLGPQEQAHRFPQFLPDGRRFVFSVIGSPDRSGTYLGALDGSPPVRLTDGTRGVVLSAPPRVTNASPDSLWLLWVRGETLVAQRLDGSKAALTGDILTLADGITGSGERLQFRISRVSVSASGLVAYRQGVAGRQQLTWLDRAGKVAGPPAAAEERDLLDPALSPDGRRLAASRSVLGNSDVWLFDGARMSRVSFDAMADTVPVWSPDGTQIVFRSTRRGQMDIYQRAASGAGVDVPLVASGQAKAPTSWSTDGRFVLFMSNDPETQSDLWAIPMTGERTPFVILKTPFREAYGVFSPDGRWVAYHSNESGRYEVYVRPFVAPSAHAGNAAAGPWQLSTAGGVYPVWRRDGREVYFLNPAGAMMAAPVGVTGATLDPGAPVALFPTRIFGGGVDEQQGRQYDVAPDGRFLINTVLDEAPAPITLIQNWKGAEQQ